MQSVAAIISFKGTFWKYLHAFLLPGDLLMLNSAAPICFFMYSAVGFHKLLTLLVPDLIICRMFYTA